MARTSYPTGSDLMDFLAGTIQVDSPSADSAILAGIADYEAQVRRHMLAGKLIDNTSVGTQTVTFDPPPDGLLVVPDLAAAPTVQYAPTGSTPQTFTLNSDYRLRPAEAPGMLQPYTSIRFAKRWYAPVPFSLVDAISITGLWGRWTSIPEDAWRAMCAAGALALSADVVLDPDGRPIPSFATGWKGASGSSESYDSTYLKNRTTEWQAQVARAVTNYRRLEI